MVSLWHLGQLPKIDAAEVAATSFYCYLAVQQKHHFLSSNKLLKEEEGGGSL